MRWIKKLRLALRLRSQIQNIRKSIFSIGRDEHHRQDNGQNIHTLFTHVIQVFDTLQEFLSSETLPPELSDYEDFPPEEVELSLAQLLVLFRQTLLQLQEMSPNVQLDAFEIL